jgi:hypothetical protein
MCMRQRDCSACKRRRIAQPLLLPAHIRHVRDYMYGQVQCEPCVGLAARMSRISATANSSAAPPPITTAKAIPLTALKFISSEEASGSFSDSELQDTPDAASRTDASKLRSLRAPKATLQKLWGHGHWPHRHHWVCALCIAICWGFCSCLLLRCDCCFCDFSTFRTATTSTFHTGGSCLPRLQLLLSPRASWSDSCLFGSGGMCTYVVLVGGPTGWLCWPESLRRYPCLHPLWPHHRLCRPNVRSVVICWHFSRVPAFWVLSAPSGAECSGCKCFRIGCHRYFGRRCRTIITSTLPYGSFDPLFFSPCSVRSTKSIDQCDLRRRLPMQSSTWQRKLRNTTHITLSVRQYMTTETQSSLYIAPRFHSQSWT